MAFYMGKNTMHKTDVYDLIFKSPFSFNPERDRERAANRKDPGDHHL